MTASEVEAAVSEELKKEFQLLEIGVRRISELFSVTINSRSQVSIEASLSMRVCNHLLMKVADDLRTAYLLGFQGFPIQTASIASSLYESAFMLCYISDSEELATTWLQHTDPTRMFVGIKELTRKGVANVFDGDGETQSETYYKRYQELCSAKHGNPMLLQTQGFEEVGDDLYLVFGAKNTKRSRQLTWFSILQAIRFSTLACTGFGKFHAPPSAANRIISVRDSCLQLADEIDKEGMRRARQ